MRPVDIETWIIDLLDEIQGAANRNENYDLHLESSYVKEIANAYDLTTWIEIH